MSADGGIGPLESLVGKWVGTGNGWNVIAVPTTPTDAKEPVSPGSVKNAVLGEAFQLEVQQMTETINIVKPVQDEAPNKGGKAGAQSSFAVEYDLIATETGLGRLHFENGMWLHLIDEIGTNPNPIARQASVPHGNSVLLMGTSSATDGAAPIADLSAVPTGPGVNAKYLEPYDTMTSRFSGVFGPNFNINKPLQDDLAAKTVVNTVTFSVSTKNGGGIVNIPFGKNAEATSWESVVWIETLADGTVQMQYTQTIIIEFFGIAWPHVVVNTLVRQ